MAGLGISLLCTLLPVVVALITVGAPAVVDLVMRPEKVPAWWGAPLAVFLPFVLMALITPALMDPGMDRVFVPMFGWGFLHLTVAGTLLGLATGLAAARGLRPGGETLRRRRTSVAAITVMLGLLLLPWLPGMLPLLWVVPPAWAGLFWVIALNRRGAPRLERGKSVSASLLYASAVSFLIAMAHFAGALEGVGDPLDLGASAWAASILVLGGMAAGLRQLTGPPAPGPLLAAAASGVSLLFPIGWSVAFRPVPSDVEVPRWVDLRGDSGSPTSAYGSHRCLQIVLPDGTERRVGPQCPYYSEAVLIDARTPLDRIPASLENQSFLVDDAHRRTSAWARYGDTLTVREEGGLAVMSDRLSAVPDTIRRPLDGALQDILLAQTDGHRPLRVERTPNWTFQDFITLCASTGERATCMLGDP
ncbi:MAG: hypothetical protein R3F61_28715 [Myxococcota bacterium]